MANDDPSHAATPLPAIASARDADEIDDDACDTTEHRDSTSVLSPPAEDDDESYASVGRISDAAHAQIEDAYPVSSDSGDSGVRVVLPDANPTDNSRGDGIVGEPLSQELQALADEVASIRLILASPTIALEDDAIRQIRAWEHRTAFTHQAANHPATRLSSERLIPVTAPTGQLTVEFTDSDLIVRGTTFDDGVYRGEVKRYSMEASVEEPGGEDTNRERFVPHGWGIATSITGLRRVGQWDNGDQVGVGTLQSAVFLYDGEWHASCGPSGYGIGTFAFGATFVGCWYHGKPYGLGRLQIFETTQYQYGWFHGTRCLQPVTLGNIDERHEACLQQHLPTQRFADQPQRGLFLVGHILEDARLSSQRFALAQWRRVACDHAIALARSRRIDAMVAWTHAHAMEQHALAWHCHNELQAYRLRMGAMLDSVRAGRDKHARVQRLRTFHANKLQAAIFQCDLAQRCLVAQEDSVVIMETERTEVGTLLEEANFAQTECERLAEQQQGIKRQIETATVKLNAMQHQMRLEEVAEESNAASQQQYQRVLSQQQLTTASFANAIRGSQHLNLVSPPTTDDTTSELRFVCDVPGCSCGIPRQVFSRVAATLNGD